MMNILRTRFPRSARRFAAFSPCVLLLALSLSGCSGGNPSPSTTQEVTASTKNPLTDLPAKDLKNAQAKGKALYAIHCALCHGETGKGDGVAGTSLAVTPTDLSSAETAAAPDGTLFLITKNGKVTNGKIVMPPVKNMSDEQVWQLVAYMRTLSKI
jgi:mono/diheme cytochrome c family protein